MTNDRNPSAHIEPVMKRAFRDLEELRAQIAESRSLRREAWGALAGSELGHMFESPDVAARYLQHPDPRLRQAALGILTSHWPPSSLITQECERLEIEDPDPEVRKTARACLITCYSKLQDARLVRVFARTVKDESSSLDLRISAYEALFMIRDMPPSTWPGMRMRSGELRFPEDVDWSFVENCLI